MKYNVRITDMGGLVPEFLKEKMVIIFNDNAPPELAEISVTHEVGELVGEVLVGDKWIFCDNEYEVPAVGEEANYTLRTLGHCSLVFDGADTAQLPGTIHLKGEKDPDIVIGKNIVIKSF